MSSLTQLSCRNVNAPVGSNIVCDIAVFDSGGQRLVARPADFELLTLQYGTASPFVFDTSVLRFTFTYSPSLVYAGINRKESIAVRLAGTNMQLSGSPVILNVTASMRISFPCILLC